MQNYKYYIWVTHEHISELFIIQFPYERMNKSIFANKLFLGRLLNEDSRVCFFSDYLPVCFNIITN